MKVKIGKTCTGLMSLTILLTIALAFFPHAALAAAPVPNAGGDTFILSADVANTTIQGRTTNPNSASLQYRWVEGGDELLLWTAVVGGECPLDLSGTTLAIGEHTLTLEVSEASDGSATVSDSMILIIDNYAPKANAGGGGSYEIGTTVNLTGQVSDFDGDTLTYEWKEGATRFCPDDPDTDTITPYPGGTPIDLPTCAVTGLGLGTHSLTLEVSDLINPSVTSTITVKIVDSTKPTLAPVASRKILWPPNHKMVNITIMANASDNSGQPVVLSASVSSNEPVNGQGDGNTVPDWAVLSIDQQTGKITVLLRAERSGKGNGREYTVRVTATDTSGNSISADVKIIVPHDQGGGDILWRHGPTGTNVVWHMKGKHLAGWEYFGGVVDPGWTIVGTDDMNNDGQPDILWRHSAKSITVVWYMNGATLVGWEFLGGVVDSSWTIVGTGDVNGDGMPDILWRHGPTGKNVVWYMNGTTFVGWEFLGGVVDSSWTIVGIDDLNTDGYPDILWRHGATGTTVVWYMNRATFAGWDFLGGAVDSSWTIAGTSDINGDGTPDILWRHSTTGTNVVWYMDEGTVTGSDFLPAVSDPNWKIVGK